MPTLYAWAESPTAATIFRAAAAVDTSRATMRRWRGSIFWALFFGLSLPSVSGLVEVGYGLQQRHVGGMVQVQPDILQTERLETQRARGVVGKVDDPAVHHGTPVIDTNHHDLAIPQVGDLDEGAQREAGVSGREIAHVEGFAAGCLFALELLSIPGRGPYLIGFGLRTVELSCFVSTGRTDRRVCDPGGFQAAWPGCGSGSQTGYR